MQVDADATSATLAHYIALLRAAAGPTLSVTQPSSGPAEDDAQVNRSLSVELDARGVAARSRRAASDVRGGTGMIAGGVLYNVDKLVAEPSHDEQKPYMDESYEEDSSLRRFVTGHRLPPDVYVS
jgi:hypothetical protein